MESKPGIETPATSLGLETGDVQGKCVCKYGPPEPVDPTRKNVLIVGDSVSIGYTPTVAKLMANDTLVQHAPWGGDGGAEETAYGLQSLDYFLHSPNGTAYKADLVYFNWGLHDGPQLFNSPPANVTIPGQEGNMSVYAGELAQITIKLKAYAAATGAKLLFAITSPMMAKLEADNDVMELNRRAAMVMTDAAVPTVDLHSAVVAKCGPVPQASCLGMKDCFSPHCGAAGYEWIATDVIVPAIRNALA
jgi:acyl-CoA thioesterase-1